MVSHATFFLLEVLFAPSAVPCLVCATTFLFLCLVGVVAFLLFPTDFFGVIFLATVFFLFSTTTYITLVSFLLSLGWPVLFHALKAGHNFKLLSGRLSFKAAMVILPELGPTLSILITKDYGKSNRECVCIRSEAITRIEGIFTKVGMGCISLVYHL